MGDNRLALEVIVHFVDKTGNRIKPMSNRIQIPLQVSEIENGDRVMMTMTLLSYIKKMFIEEEFVQNLALVPERAEKLEEQYGSGYCKLFALDYFPVLDDIEIQEIQRNDP